MNEKMKNHLVLVAIIGILSASYAALSFSRSYSNSIQPSSFRSFSVSAEGKAVSIPDIALVSFGVITEGGKDIGALQKENSEKANKAIAFLKSKGIAAADIKTEQYSIDPRSEYNPCEFGKKCPPPSIVGYTISQRVSIKIRKFDAIGEILAGLVVSGANSVSGPSFSLDDPTSVESSARAEALKKARAKAEEIAKAGRFGLGRILNIYENGPTPFYSYAMKETAIGRGGVDATILPVISPGSEEVKINISVTYEIR